MPFGDARDTGEDLPWRAVAALKCVVLDEGRLQWVQHITARDALNGGNARSVVHDRQSQTRIDPPAIEQHGACATCTLIAALLCPGQLQMLAQSVEQRGARIQAQTLRVAIDNQLDLDGVRGCHESLLCRCCWASAPEKLFSQLPLTSVAHLLDNSRHLAAPTSPGGGPSGEQLAPGPTRIGECGVRWQA